MAITFIQGITGLLLPPFDLIILFFIAGVLQYFRYKAAKPVFITAFVLFYLFSTPIFSYLLMSCLENYPPLTANQIKNNDRDVIIVLGAGKANAKEFNRFKSVTPFSLMRLRYAAYLHKKTGLPVIVTGGSAKIGQALEAPLMADVLENEFGVPNVIQEDKSRNTAQNARFSAKIMQARGFHKAFIVTQAWHMPRAMLAFKQAGVDAIAAPTAFETGDLHWKFSLFIPDASAFHETYYAMHELLGWLWYYLRY